MDKNKTKKKPARQTPDAPRPDNDNTPVKPNEGPPGFKRKKNAFTKSFDDYLLQRAKSIKALCQSLAIAQQLSLEMKKDNSKRDKVLAYLEENGIKVTAATTIEHAAVKVLAPASMLVEEGRKPNEFGSDRKKINNWAAAIQGANDVGIAPSEFPAWVEKVGGLERAKAFRHSDSPQIKVPRANESRDYLYRKPKFNDQTIEIPLHRFGYYTGDFFIAICRKVSGENFDVIAVVKDQEVINRAAKCVYKNDVEKAMEKRQAAQAVVKNADNDENEDEAA